MLKQIKANSLFKFIGNRYVIILFVFIIWMLFLDENSYQIHRKYNKEISDLKRSNGYYEQKINQYNKTIKTLKDSLEIERFAREKYLLKKENEDLFIIKFDSINNK